MFSSKKTDEPTPDDDPKAAERARMMAIYKSPSTKKVNPEPTMRGELTQQDRIAALVAEAEKRANALARLLEAKRLDWTNKLFDQVVVISGLSDSPLVRHTYFFVLTYIPDLQWCHVAPLQRGGHFRADLHGAEHAGKQKWVLVPEGNGEEYDVSASRCTVSTREHDENDVRAMPWRFVFKAKLKLTTRYLYVLIFFLRWCRRWP